MWSIRMKRSINTIPFHLWEQNEINNNRCTCPASPYCVRVGCAHTKKHTTSSACLTNRIYYHRDTLYVICKEVQFKTITIMLMYQNCECTSVWADIDKRSRISAGHEMKRLCVCSGSWKSAYLFLTASDPVSMHLALCELLSTLQKRKKKKRRSNMNTLITQQTQTTWVCCVINKLKCWGNKLPWYCRHYLLLKQWMRSRLHEGQCFKTYF